MPNTEEDGPGAPSSARSDLRSIINEVANDESSPNFEPHITIVSVALPAKIPTLDDLSSVLKGYSKLDLNFKSIFVGSSYFMSVALLLEPTLDLLEFQKDVCLTFFDAIGVENPGKPFIPHISLFYGDRTQEERERIASFIRSKWVTTENDNGVSIKGRSGCFSHEMWVVKTEGSVRHWEVLAKIGIGSIEGDGT